MTARSLVFLLLLAVPNFSSQTLTHFPADPDSSQKVNALRNQVEAGRLQAVPRFWATVSRIGSPLIEPIPGVKDFSLLTFLWRGDDRTRNVVVFDGIAGFDAKDQMIHLAGTDVWYKSYRVRNDARFAYNLSPNDSLESFDDIKSDEQMQKRLAMLQVDPLNPRRCPTTFGSHGAQSSYVELPNAPPLLWERPLKGIRRGKVEVGSINSIFLGRDKKLWVYTPAGFSHTGKRYPLLVIFDGDRNVEWIPKILDLLITERKLPPIVAVMTDQSVPSIRREELPCNSRFADFVAKELVPWSRSKYRATMQPQDTTVAGSSYGGLASIFVGLTHSDVFGNVISLSGSFWWKPEEDTQPQWLKRQVSRSPKLPLRFYLEVGLMEGYPMQIEANRQMAETLTAKGYPLEYHEYDGGHSFLNWSEGMTRGLQYIMKTRRQPTSTGVADPG